MNGVGGGGEKIGEGSVSEEPQGTSSVTTPPLDSPAREVGRMAGSKARGSMWGTGGCGGRCGSGG